MRAMASQPDAHSFPPEGSLFDLLVAERTSMLCLLTPDVREYVLRPVVAPSFVLATYEDGSVNALRIDGCPSSPGPIWQARTHSLAVTRENGPDEQFGVVGLGQRLLSNCFHRGGGSLCAFDPRSGVVDTAVTFESRLELADQCDAYSWFKFVGDGCDTYAVVVETVRGRYRPVNQAVVLSGETWHKGRFIGLNSPAEIRDQEKDLVLDDRRHRCFVVSGCIQPGVGFATRHVCLLDLVTGVVAPTQIAPRSVWNYEGAVVLDNTIGLAEAFPNANLYREYDLRTPAETAVLTIALTCHSQWTITFEERVLVGDRHENVYSKCSSFDALFSVDRRAESHVLLPTEFAFDGKIPKKLTFCP